MLTQTNLKRRVSQSALKYTTCHAGCGSTVSYRTSPRVICEKCKPSHRREQVRASVAKQRRKRGIPEVKGKTIACCDCGFQVTLDRSLAKTRCDKCQVEHARKRAKSVSREKCRARKAPQVGAVSYCRLCSGEFVRTGSRNFLCVDCGEKSVARKLTAEQMSRARDYKRAWESANKVLVANYQKASRSRRKEFPAFSINERMSAGVRYSLSNRKNGASWEKLVGYSVTDLMPHLERQFLPGMTWANRGEWHIDHIRPLCSFEFTTPDCPQFREAWAMSNLRPLWACDNISKSGRRDLLL